MTRFSHYPTLKYPEFCLILGLFLAACSNISWASGCGSWLSAEADTSKGKYSEGLTIRACELHQGVSAFIQIQNDNAEKLKVFYRVHTVRGTPKEAEIEATGGAITRGNTCQACTQRRGGIKHWEILNVESLGLGAEGLSEASLDSKAPQQKIEELQRAIAALEREKEFQRKEEELKREQEIQRQKESERIKVIKPLTVEPIVKLAAKPTTAAPTKIKEPAPKLKNSTPKLKKPAFKTLNHKDKPAPQNAQKPADGEEVDGLVTDDGTVIPWDQVPPEFRPKDKR